MAPMMTAVELMLRPAEAITIEQARIQTLGPRKGMAERIRSLAATVSISPSILTIFLSLERKICQWVCMLLKLVVQI